MSWKDLAVELDPALLLELAGLEPDEWQRELLRTEAAQVLLCCSRQAGKSTVVALLACLEMLYRAPALVLLVSPSIRQSAELLRKVIALYESLRKPVPIAQESGLRLELKNGSRVVSLPGRPDTIRGFSGVSLLVVDEAAWVPDALYYAIRPMLAVSRGRLAALSTPFGRRGWFFECWEQGSSDDWHKIQVTAHQVGRISSQFLEAERRSMPLNWFRSEYLCEFVDTEDSVFRYEDVMNALSNDVEPLF